jgi:hypothetical protein
MCTSKNRNWNSQHIDKAEQRHVSNRNVHKPSDSTQSPTNTRPWISVWKPDRNLAPGLLAVQKPTLGDFYIAFHLLMIYAFQRQEGRCRIFSRAIRLGIGHPRSRGSIPGRVKPFISHTNALCGPAQLRRYSDLLMAGRSGYRIPVGVRFSAPDRPWSPSSPLYNGYWVSFPGVKRLGRGVDYPPPHSVEVKESVELHL